MIPGHNSAPSPSDPLGMSSRERSLATLERFDRVIAEGICRGGDDKFTHVDEWGDPWFRAYLLGKLRRIAELERAAADLAVITRVFGGNPRS